MGGWSVGYCQGKINDCRRYLNDLNDDLKKLNQLNAILGEVASKVSSGGNILNTSKNILYSGFGGNKANSHFSKITEIINDAKTASAEIENGQATVNEKIGFCNEEVEKTRDNLQYWQRKLQEAYAEQASSK